MKKLYLYNLYHKTSVAGLHQINDPHDRKSLLFINKMSLVNTGFLLAFSMVVLFFGLFAMLFLTIPFMILFALPPLLNHRGKLHHCRYFFSVLPLLFLIGVCIHNGSLLGDKYLVLTTATIPLILFKDKKSIYGLFALNVLVFFLIEVYQSHFSPITVLPEFVQKQYYIYAQLTVFAIIFFVVLYFRKDTEDYESELEEKNKMISEKNHEIIDSIVYAQRLQKAIMPPESEIYENVPESFILYKPKDIVAGDFYFAGTKGDHFFIAAADCTGHGVPGAMVSMVCSNALNRAVEEFGLIQPGEILDKVTEIVVHSLNKSNKDVKDGMDISLAVLNKKTGEIAWAGANNPLWYIPGMEENITELNEITANKQPVGKSEKRESFTTHVLKLAKGSILYLFTDGYADQFGGPKGKKFKYKQLAELLLSIRHLDMKLQRERLDASFESWKGDLEQIDDVCIIGLRI